ncbi:MAG: M48 family metallopeptidase [Gammaproteobacteria bacterium]|nr:M48 family metallopeptidase [Gammaproteobacteria bacterium]NND54112.1 M48 family metallopeptidase [Gammaproteobacteria bacterium]
MQKFLLLAAAFILTSCVTPAQLQQASVAEFAKMREELDVSENAADRAFVQCVADALIVQLEEPYRSYDWDLELFEDDAINAFAMPGGQIGVFTGLFKTATNQHQLAAVMGHEIAHVTSGHSLKRANSQAATQVGILVGAMASEAVRNNAGLIVLGAQLGLLLPYGRAQESEADIDGLDLMAQAGFRPDASVELWRNMAEESPRSMPQFLSTHPSSDTRIEQLQARLPAVEPVYEQARAAGLRPDCSR